MAYFPLMVDIRDKEVLIVGGGETALRKTELMLDFGAKVRLISKEFLCDFPKEAKLIQKGFAPEDIASAGALPFLIIAATDDREVNALVAKLAGERRIPVNVVDDEPLCSFTVPAVIRDRDVVISVSSGGKSPLVTQYVKKLMLEAMPDDIGEINDEMGRLRREVKASIPDQRERRKELKEALARLLKK